MTLHAPSIMNAILLACVFSVENKMPGGYWSRTGTADLSGALLHQKNGTVQCRSTLAVGETSRPFPLITRGREERVWRHGLA